MSNLVSNICFLVLRVFNSQILKNLHFTNENYLTLDFHTNTALGGMFALITHDPLTSAKSSIVGLGPRFVDLEHYGIFITETFAWWDNSEKVVSAPFYSVIGLGLYNLLRFLVWQAKDMMTVNRCFSHFNVTFCKTKLPLSNFGKLLYWRGYNRNNVLLPNWCQGL